MNKTYDFKSLFADARKDPAYWLEGAVLSFTEDMLKIMDDQGMSRSELARRIGTSPAYITKILRGSTNFTFESVVKIAMALECEFKPQLKPKVAAVRTSDWLDDFEPCHVTSFRPLYTEMPTAQHYRAVAANQEMDHDSLAAVA